MGGGDSEAVAVVAVQVRRRRLELILDEHGPNSTKLASIKVADGADKKLSKDSIPSILQEALAVSFDEYIGHDYGFFCLFVE